MTRCQLKREVAMSNQDWNPRFTLYAKSNGLSEQAQIEKDREVWKGGRMAGFSLWIRRKWSEWWKQYRGTRKDLPRSVRSAMLGSEEHARFDEWLRENYND